MSSSLRRNRSNRDEQLQPLPAKRRRNTVRVQDSPRHENAVCRKNQDKAALCMDRRSTRIRESVCGGGGSLSSCSSNCSNGGSRSRSSGGQRRSTRVRRNAIDSGTKDSASRMSDDSGGAGGREKSSQSSHKNSSNSSRTSKGISIRNSKSNSSGGGGGGGGRAGRSSVNRTGQGSKQQGGPSSSPLPFERLSSQLPAQPQVRLSAQPLCVFFNQGCFAHHTTSTPYHTV